MCNEVRELIQQTDERAAEYEEAAKGWRKVAEIAQGENRRLIGILHNRGLEAGELSQTLAEHSATVARELDDVQARWQRCEDQRFAACEQIAALEHHLQNAAKVDQMRCEELHRRASELEELRNANVALTLQVSVQATALEEKAAEAADLRAAVKDQIEGGARALAEKESDLEAVEAATSNLNRHLQRVFRRGMRIAQNRIDRLEADLTVSEEVAAGLQAERLLPSPSESHRPGAPEPSLLDAVCPEPEQTDPMHQIPGAFEGAEPVCCARCGRPQEADEGFVQGPNNEKLCFGCFEALGDGLEELDDTKPGRVWVEFWPGGRMPHVVAVASMDSDAQPGHGAEEYWLAGIVEAGLTERDAKIEQLTGRVDELVRQLDARQKAGNACSGVQYAAGGSALAGMVRGRGYGGERRPRNQRETSGVSVDLGGGTKGRTSTYCAGNCSRVSVTGEPSESACQKSAIGSTSQEPEPVSSSETGQADDGLKELAAGLVDFLVARLRRVVG